MPASRIELVAITHAGEPETAVTMPPEIRDVLATTRSLYEREGFEKPWVSYLAAQGAAVVGLGAFKSPPREGRVEIAYMTAPAHEGQGIATAVASALIALARAAAPEIDIRAQTLREENASVAILRKLGFRFAGEVLHKEDGLVWEWSLPPAQDRVRSA